jgi:uncharacterized membrane protein
MAISTEHHASSNLEGSSERYYLRHAFSVAALLAVIAFLLAPWPFEIKAHAVLHGICGQTADHTSSFDGKLLPLDDRCVGIYSGLLSTFLILMALGRKRAAGLPSPAAGVVLALFLGALAVDGFNSLFTDLGLSHPYTPSNGLRLLTGWMAGIGIGTLMAVLTALVLWQRPRTDDRVLPSWWWPLLLLLPVVPAWILIGTGSSVVYYPYTLFLMLSAIVAFSTLALCTVVMLRNKENVYDRIGQLTPLATLAMFAAIGVLLALAGARFWFEAATHVPALV